MTQAPFCCPSCGAELRMPGRAPKDGALDCSSCGCPVSITAVDVELQRIEDREAEGYDFGDEVEEEEP